MGWGQTETRGDPGPCDARTDSGLRSVYGEAVGVFKDESDGVRRG